MCTACASVIDARWWWWWGVEEFDSTRLDTIDISLCMTSCASKWTKIIESGTHLLMGEVGGRGMQISKIQKDNAGGFRANCELL